MAVNTAVKILAHGQAFEPWAVLDFHKRRACAVRMERCKVFMGIQFAGTAGNHALKNQVKGGGILCFSTLGFGVRVADKCAVEFARDMQPGWALNKLRVVQINTVAPVKQSNGSG
nr:MAG TPA: hypothetical protein [Caudoviricetes sp.]